MRKISLFKESVNIPLFNEFTIKEGIETLYSFKEAAEELGWKVIPVVILRESPDKKFKKIPVTRQNFEPDWEKEKLFERIKRIIEGYSKSGTPEAYLGLGLLTGKVNGITVIDFDTEEKWEEFREIYQGETLVQKTNNGYHVIFRYIPEVKNGTGRGVDARNDGGFIVIPPAKGYRFENLALDDEGKVKIEEAPPEVLEFLKKEGLLKGQQSVTKFNFSKVEGGIELEGEIKNPALFVEVVKTALQEGIVTGYDVDLLISALAKRGISEKFIERLAKEVFGKEYDERRTYYMIERGLTLSRLRDIGSFAFKLPEDLKREFLKSLGWRKNRAFTRKKIFSGKIVERYINLLQREYCKLLNCDGGETLTLRGGKFTVEFSLDKVGELLEDDYYKIYVYMEKLSLPEEVTIGNRTVESVTYPAHLLAIGEKSSFSIRVLAKTSVGRVENTHVPKEELSPKEKKGEELVVVTDRIDEFNSTELPVKVIYSPFPELFLDRKGGVIFAGVSLEKAVKEKAFAKVVGVAGGLKEVKEALEGKGKLLKPVDVGLSFLKKEFSKILGWLKLSGEVPACIERYLENIEKDRNPYRVQGFIAFLKKFADTLFEEYGWVIKDLLDVSVNVSEKDGKAASKAEKIVIPPAFPCLCFAENYCPHGSWRKCGVQRFGDLFKVDVEMLNLREDTVVMSLDVVGQGVVKKEITRGLEVDRIVRKLGAMVEPLIIKFYKPLLELEITKALSQAKEVLFPTRIRLKIIHYAKEAIIKLIAEGRFAIKEEKGERFIYLPVNFLYENIKGEFEKPLSEKVRYEEIREIVDEYFGAYKVRGQIQLNNGKVRVVYKLPEKIFNWFMEEVEGTIPNEHYIQKLEVAFKLAKEKLSKLEKEEILLKENHGVSDQLIDYMENDIEFKEEVKKKIVKEITGEETPEDKFDSLIPSQDKDVVLYWDNDECEGMPEELVESFCGVPVREEWDLKVGESRQEGKVKKTRIDEDTLLLEKEGKKVYITKKYEKFIKLWEELSEKYGDKFVPVTKNDEAFIYTVMNHILNVPIGMDEIEVRTPTVGENKRKELMRKTIELLKKEIGEEKYKEMLTRLQLGDTKMAEEALEKAKGIYRFLQEAEKKKCDKLSEDVIDEEEMEDVEDIIGFLEDE